MNKISTSLICCLAYCSLVHAQWMYMNQPSGAHAIDCFTNYRNTGFGIQYVFAGTDNSGIFLTPDNGGIWVKEDIGLVNKRILAIASYQSYLMVGTFGGGMFVSPDSGTTWSQANSGMPARFIWRIATLGNTVFAASDDLPWDGGGIYTSTNGGSDWSLRISGDFRSITVKGTHVYAFRGSLLFSSPDTGFSWSAGYYLGYTPTCLLTFGNDLFAGTNLGPGVFRSTDEGVTWIPAGDGLEEHTNVLALAGVGTKLFAGCGYYSGASTGGLFISTDSGSHWVSAGLTGISVYSLDVKGSVILAATAEGLARSTDEGASWNWSETSFWPDYPTCVAHSQTALIAGTYESGVFLSIDDGVSWYPSNNGLTISEVNSLLISGSDFYAAANGGILHSDITAAILWSPLIWDRINRGITNLNMTALAMSPDTLSIFTGSLGGGIFMSTNKGINWSQVNNGITNDSVLCLMFHEDTLYAGTSGGGIFCSTNKGEHWAERNEGLGDLTVTSFAQIGHDLFAATKTGGLFESDDHGLSWRGIDTTLTGSHTLSFVASDSLLFTGTTNGVFMLRKYLSTWSVTSCGLPGIGIHALAINIGDLIASTPSAVLKRPLSQLTTVSCFPSDLPHLIWLKPNYPNPFNPITSISFTLAKRGFVSLKILNVLGEEIATLVSGQLEAGEYTRNWNGTNQSSGVYFCRLQAGSSTETIKLLLIR